MRHIFFFIVFFSLITNAFGQNPCQPFVVDITNPSPIPFYDGDTIHICQNIPLTLHATGTYGAATNYTQSDNTTTFTWNFGDGTAQVTGVGAAFTSVTHTWPQGAYYVTLKGKDINNCYNTNLARIMVIVSTTPTFDGTNITPDTICPGETIVLDGRHVQGHPWSQVVDTMVAGLTSLPDGGCANPPPCNAYETSISNTLFLPGQNMLAVTDVVNVCLNLEHSYLGDLTIHLVCPNGQFLNILTYSTNSLGSTWFGIPVDNDTQPTATGTGWTYCWTPQATTPLPSLIGASAPAGDYQPTGPFSALVGCPMNGQWTIHVEDHLNSDNGFIFWWGMQFNQAIIPPQFTFENEHDSTIFNWLGPNITTQNNGFGAAAPTTPGTNVYTLEIADDFGCFYDTTAQVYVRPLNSTSCCIQPIPFAGAFDTVCGTSYTFQATLAAGHTGVWSQLPFPVAPATASIASPASPNSLVTAPQWGTYYFKWTESVTGQASCTQSDTVAITFYQPPTSTFTTTPVNCFGDSTLLTYTGNTVAPAFFDWQVGGVGLSTPAINSNSAGPYTVEWPVAGNYNVSLQVTQNGCVSPVTTVPVLTPPLLQHSSVLVHNLCFGNALGSVTITSTGGTLPLTYIWGATAGTNVLGNLVAGTYNLSVHDANGCDYTDTYIITEPLILQKDTFFKNIDCFAGNDGFANIVVSGGTGVYNYVWSPVLPNASLQTNLTANTYRVTVTDANACSLSETYVLNQPALLSVTGSQDDAICFGASSTMQATCTGGVTPYTYIWNGVPGTNTSLTVIPTNTTNYFLQVKDSYNCFSNIENIEIVVSPKMVASLIVNDNKCYNSCDGSANYAVLGGLTPLTYSWPSTNNILENLCVGVYQVTVTDQIGCFIDTVFSVDQPTQLLATTSSIPATCNGYNNGSAEVTVQGGTLPYSYFWSNGGNAALSDYLFAGVYTCQVTDANACVVKPYVTVTEPSKVYVSSSDDQTICIGGSTDISAQAMGGAYPYIYEWYADTMAYTGSMIHIAPLTSTVYNLTVTDANDCKGNMQTVKVNVLPPLTIDSYTIDDTICPGDAANIRVSVSGGSGGPYRIYLNNGTIVAPPFDVYPMQSQTYTMMAYDKCETPAVKDSVAVFVLPLPPIDAHVNVFKGCVPLNVTFIESSPDSGQTYLWRFGEGLISEGSIAKNTTHKFQYPGTYAVTLTVTSQYGCTRTDTVGTPINVYPLPDARFILDPPVVSIANPKVVFTNLSLGTDTSYWSFGDGDSSLQTNPIHYYASIGTYRVDLIATTKYNCIDIVSETVSVRDEYTTYAPTGFSPNNDGKNDFFSISGNGIHPDNFNLLIYNRWGEVVFTTRDKEAVWDGKFKGKTVEEGSYPWALYYKDTNGTNYQKAGIVTVVR